MTVPRSTVLKTVRALLQGEKHWARGAMARTAHGDMCDARAQEAACWCIYGSFLRTSPTYAGSKMDPDWLVAWTFLQTIAAGEAGHNPVAINDYLGYDPLMRLLEKAIVAAEAVEAGL